MYSCLYWCSDAIICDFTHIKILLVLTMTEN